MIPVLAEFLGTAGLLIVVVGSGIMGETLAGGNAALALLANSLATGAGLFALIQTFGGISGAHFNPVVSLIEFLSKRLSAKGVAAYLLAQVVGGILGVLLSHAMFGQALLQLSTHDRGHPRFLLSEFIATFGLLLVVTLAGKRDAAKVPMSVALYITAAYWCTSSTSFANPAVTIARSLTDSFSGVLWTNVPALVLAQVCGAIAAMKVSSFLTGSRASTWQGLVVSTKRKD